MFIVGILALIVFWLPGGVFKIFAALGGAMNATAMIGNRGFMPVVREEYLCKTGKNSISEEDKDHVFAQHNTHLRFFIDRIGHPLLFPGVGSVGDIFIFASIIIQTAHRLIVSW